MNTTKATLVRVSGIFAILDCFVSLITGIVLLTTTGYFGEALTGSGMAFAPFNIPKEVFIAVGAVLVVLSVASIIGGILLLQVTGSGRVFKNTTAKYRAGCALTIIGGAFFSVASLLLYISFFFKNQPAAELRSGEFNQHTEYDDDNPYDEDYETKRKISLLRELKSKGAISDNQFKEMLLNVISKKEQN